MKHLLTIIAIISFLCLSCSKDREQSKSAPGKEYDKSMRSMNQEKKSDIISEDKQSKKRVTNKSSLDKEKSNLQRTLYTPVKLAEKRLLEYIINLRYMCNNLPDSRQQIIQIISKYGFIKNSNAATGGSYDYMNIEMYIRIDALYNALLELDELGLLKGESIRVKDHTATNVWNTIKSRRELTRIGRKSRAIGGIAPYAKNWNAINSSLENSENTRDKTIFKKWKIKDKVSWAKVHVFLKTPENPKKIIVPKYTDALKTVINMLLELLYALIILLPFIALIVIIIRKRNAIKRIFSKKQE